MTSATGASLDVEGLELATAFGTPLYVYDLSDVRSAYAALRAALPESAGLFYSLKANPHPEIVRQLAGLGCQAEVSSSGELSAALAGGVHPSACMYTGPAKTAEEIQQAIYRGVRMFSIESLAELRRVTSAVESARVCARALLRINGGRPPGHSGLVMSGMPSQFGIDADQLVERPNDFAGTGHLRVVGFHWYVATNVSSADELLATFSFALRSSAELAERLKIDVQFLDLGGGFGHPVGTAGQRYDFSRLREPIESALAAAFPRRRAGMPRIAFESGRYLVGGAGRLLCQVRDVKWTKGQAFILVDGGINVLGGMAGLGRVPRMAIEIQKIGQDGDPAPPLADATIAGPLCTPTDVLARHVQAPSVDRDDVIRIPNVGAYGLTASLLGFLGRPCPVEVVVDRGTVVSASRLVVTRVSEKRRNVQE